MSSREPATVSISLEEFARHGGLTGPHKDGWGVVYYAGNDVHVMREPSPASESPSIDFIRSQHYRSRIVVSHIRQASAGAVRMANTQPYCRELGGRMHTFAHNGDLEDIGRIDVKQLGHFRPIGDSDSELAFCLLMGAMERLWLSTSPPTASDRMEVVAEVAARIREMGPANFIYSDGEILFAHGHKRSQRPDPAIRPPGLFTLCRVCEAKLPKDRTGPANGKIDGLVIDFPNRRGKKQEVLLLASVPLTNEKWTPLEEGQILAVSSGKILRLG